MRKIKNNPPLTLNSLEKITTGENCNLIVSIDNKKTGIILFNALFDSWAFEYRNEYIDEIKLAKKFNFNVVILKNLKVNEWILITPKNIYYSKGNNTN